MVYCHLFIAIAVRLQQMNKRLQQTNQRFTLITSFDKTFLYGTAKTK
jgi:hypothetical protein